METSAYGGHMKDVVTRGNTWHMRKAHRNIFRTHMGKERKKKMKKERKKEKKRERKRRKTRREAKGRRMDCLNLSNA